MSFTSIVSVWVEMAGLSRGWYVMVKDDLGCRHTVGDPYGTLDAALKAAQHLLFQLS